MKVRVVRKFNVATGICGFDLARDDAKALPAFSAGAHIDVKLATGLVRQYSLCNNPSETHRYVIAVLCEPASRGGSVAMHALPEGSVLSISEPRNHFPLTESAAHSLLIAGGIGITPILSMAERLTVLDSPFELHYCTREPTRTAFREHLIESGFATHVHLYFDTEPSSARINLAAVLADPIPDGHLYVCGPAGFIASVLDTASTTGWIRQQLHHEYFVPAPLENTAKNDSFQVKLEASGRIIEVRSDETVIMALAAAGVDVLTSCEQGVCGTCLTRVLEGEPDHRDVYLTDEERAANDCFLPCCSRSKSPILVLDI